MISRVRLGFEGVFFGSDRVGVGKFGRGIKGFATLATRGLGVPGAVRGVVIPDDAGVPNSGGSEDGGSELGGALRGVRKGDLNGLWSVLFASLRRRRLACGVDIPAAICTSGAFNWIGERAKMYCVRIG
jgi:hypothetical protein